ncbi:MAG TPA: hypothetical protein VEA69_22160 [Tepidisphaeraceae bacterium]|nr:hypothetical protein [Tepidisphaeraceae bacterium]
MNNVTLGYLLVALVCAYSAFLVAINLRAVWPAGWPRHRIAPALAGLLLAGLAPAARAHFVFVVPQDGGNTARVVMSEDLKPDDGVDVSIIAGAKLHAVGADGKDTPIALGTAAKDSYTIAVPGGSRVVYGVTDLGWTKRGKEGKPHVLLYHAKTVLGDAFAQGTTLGVDRAPVELVPTGKPGALRLAVHVAGKPVAAGVEVVVITPDGKEQRVKTEADGATPALTALGRYGAWARHWENTPGERDGKAYEQLRRYATLVVDVAPPATAAAKDDKPAAPGAPVTQFVKLPEATSSFGAVACDGHLYVFGGHIAPTHSYSTAAVSGKLHRLSLAKPDAAWETLTGGTGMQGMNLATHGGNVYRVGGMVPKNAPGEKADNWSTTQAVRFDPKAGKWEELPAMPTPRSSHDVAVIGDTLYVLGGWDMRGAKGGNHWLDHMITLDLSAKDATWQKIEQPWERRALIAAVLDGKLYAMGGFDDQSDPSRRVEIYDPATKKWSNGPELPGQDRNGFAPAACVHRGRLYVSVADGSLFRLGAGTWDKVAQTTPRIVHRLVSDGGRILVIGGATKGGNLDLVEAVAIE